MSESSTAQKPAPHTNSRPGVELEQTTSAQLATTTTKGTTTIADTVVQKIAGLAAREISGVHNLGGGTARAFGAIRELVPGTNPGSTAGQGVTVEVGEKQAAIDLQIQVDYGVAIAELAKAIRKNVITAIEQMTGLEVVEVNITVTDVHIPGDDQDSAPSNEPTRVQ